MINLVRKDGQQQVTAYHDTVLFNYAMAGYNGVILGVGNQFAYDISTANIFRIKSGMAVVDGVQFEIPAGASEEIALQPAAGDTVYWYSVRAEIDLRDSSAPTVNIVGLWETGRYPETPTGDNLVLHRNGRAYLDLYRFKQTSAGVTDIETLFHAIVPGSAKEAEHAVKADLAINAQAINGLPLREEGETLRINDYRIEKKILLYDTPKRVNNGELVFIDTIPVEGQMYEIYIDGYGFIRYKAGREAFYNYGLNMGVGLMPASANKLSFRSFYLMSTNEVNSKAVLAIQIYRYNIQQEDNSWHKVETALDIERVYRVVI